MDISHKVRKDYTQSVQKIHAKSAEKDMVYIRALYKVSLRSLRHLCGLCEINYVT